jgi:hypothetical protein
MDKGHRREMELTIEAMEKGREAPIPFAQLIEVTEATFAIEEAIRTQRTVPLRARAEYATAAAEAMSRAGGHLDGIV